MAGRLAGGGPTQAPDPLATEDNGKEVGGGGFEEAARLLESLS